MFEFGAGLHEHDRRVRDVDRGVVHGELAGIRRGRVEQLGPLGGRGRDLVGAPHEQVRAAAVRHAVVHAVDRVVVLVLEVREDLGVARDQVHVDRLDEAAGDEAQAGVARRGDDVVLRRVGLEERERLIRGPEGLDRDLAAGLGLERRDPVDVRAGGPVLHVARPREDRNLALAVADLGRQRRAARCGRTATDAVTGGQYEGHRRERDGEPLCPHPVPPPRAFGAATWLRHRRRCAARAVASTPGGQPCPLVRVPRTTSSRGSAG